jgi:hypothetical protein
MPLPGGPSDKIGNRYERRWTVRALIDLLQGTATSVRVEVPGPEGTATEFRRTDNDGHTWHQAKRQNTAGSWTIATLTGPGVIDAMWTKGSVGERFTFVSSIGVTFLTELTERAGQARDYDDFNTNFINDDGHKNAFQKLRDQWKATSEQAYNALLLIKIVVIDEESLQTWNVDALRPWVDNPEGAADILGQLVDESVHKELTKHASLAKVPFRAYTERQVQYRGRDRDPDWPCAAAGPDSHDKPPTWIPRRYASPLAWRCGSRCCRVWLRVSVPRWPRSARGRGNTGFE